MTYKQYVQKFGREFGEPEDFKYGMEKACYWNAACRALRDKDLTYVEGVGHAWVVNAADRVIEVTWSRSASYEAVHDMGIRYYGVTYRTEWLREVVERRGGLMIMESGLHVSLPSLDYLVFEPLGWEALAAGIKPQ